MKTDALFFAQQLRDTALRFLNERNELREALDAILMEVSLLPQDMLSHDMQDAINTGRVAIAKAEGR